MPATQKKKSTANSGKKSAASGKTSAADRKKLAASQPKRREIAAVLCLILGALFFIGYFTTGIVIDVFRDLMKGLLGWGYYFLPFSLLICAWILGFHRGRPVALRVFSVLMLPILIGGLLHIFVSDRQYEWGFAMLGQLYKDGASADVKSGGLISGFLASALSALFSKTGAIFLFICGLIVFVMAATENTFASIVDQIKNRERRAYDPEAYSSPEEYEQPVPEYPRMTKAERQRRKSMIDIPIDDPPNPPPENKETYFNKKKNVRSPDEVLSGKTAVSEDVFDVPIRDSQAVRQEERKSASASEIKVKSFEKPDNESVVEQRSTAAYIPPVPLTVDEAQIQDKPAAQDKIAPQEIESERRDIEKSIEKSFSETEEKKQYVYPPVSLLSAGGPIGATDSRDEIKMNARRLESAIQSFGINAKICNIVRGPSVTRYELELEQGVKLNKLTNLADDIALSLGATGVRIAPIPDKISIVGIEVPNKLVKTVYLREIIESQKFKASASKTSFAIGMDIGGNCIVGDISKLPHLLIAGTTGSGKSVCMNSLILSLLYKASPDEVRLIMIDPKMIELGIYNGIPHLLIPVVTDPKKAAGALQWAVSEMMKRYRLFSEVGARDIASYNAICARDEERETLPQIVILIDELADLMLVAAKEVEESICRVAQMGRASGMHLVIATQRPSADVITGLMKANIPSRIAFAVDSALNSRIILDTTGAEKLVGKGDMLYFPLGQGKPLRVQGTFVTDEEREKVVDFVKKSGIADYSEEIIEHIEKKAEEGSAKADGKSGSAGDYDELLPAAVEVFLESGQASVSMLQRRLKLGYSRAARLVDQMEELNIVGPFEGSKPRQVLITREQWMEMKFINGAADEMGGKTGEM